MVEVCSFCGRALPHRVVVDRDGKYLGCYGESRGYKLVKGKN